LATSRARPRDEERPAGVLAKAGSEQGGGAQLGDDELLDLVGLQQDEIGARRLLGVRQMDDDPVVGVDGVRLEPDLLADPGAQRQRPGGVDAASVRAEHAQAPVADLVAEPFDHDRAVRGHHACRLLLLDEELHEIGGGTPVQVVLTFQALG
jgi:hypothetical protein